eukprot:s7080_g5.t1
MAASIRLSLRDDLHQLASVGCRSHSATGHSQTFYKDLAVFPLSSSDFVSSRCEKETLETALAVNTFACL